MRNPILHSILGLLFLAPAAMSAARDIPSPRLMFEPDHLSQLETCILDNLLSQSPDHLQSVIPGGAPIYVEDELGNPIRSTVEMLVAGMKEGDERVGYNVRFTTADQSDWLYFQSGSSYGAYAANMSVLVDVINFRSGDRVFVADLSNCR
jgi:hypothetical protein